MLWASGVTVLLLCAMFITKDGFVNWMNQENSAISWVTFLPGPSLQ